MTVTVADVEKLAKNGWNQLSQDRKEALLEDAEAEADSIYSGRMSRTPTLVGPRDQFVKYLTAHKLELSEGGEANSESGEGGSVSYQSSQSEDYLTLTRYGETAKRYVRNDESIAIQRSY